MRSTGIHSRRTCAAHASLLAVLLVLSAVAPRRTGAQSSQTLEPGQLPLLIDIAFSRALATTVADDHAAGTVTLAAGAARQTESMRLRLNGQWGYAAEVRVPFGERQRWGIELSGARYRGRGEGTYETHDTLLTGGGGTSSDLRVYHLRRMTSWRTTLGVARGVPVGSYTGVAFLGGTYGRIRSNGSTCPSGSTTGSPVCAPVGALDMDTPGVTTGFDVMSRPWHRLVVRLGGKADVLSIDEADARRALKPPALTSVATSESERVWRVLPSVTFGLLIQFRR